MNAMWKDILKSSFECESKYKVLEELSPVPEMTPAQLEELNAALKVSPKGVDYRPYCLHANCKVMPRMYRIANGFKCWSCNNEIGFNLKPLQRLEP